MTNNGLIVFIKNPELGKAKTRIGKEVGFDKSKEIYLELLDITRRTVLAVDADRYLFYSDYVNNDDHWSNSQFHKLTQKGNDLGVKMKNAFSSVLKECNSAIILGSDCPYITPELINEALESLNKKDVVIGPAEDGGYYLLGIKRMIPELFNNMEWSTTTVFEETVERVHKLDMSVEILKSLSDIDYWDDWQRYLEYIS